ncbi:SusC/RagA family TonB-linked outer membrane protein [Catenovulum sp. SX2]|uniref:SusC/RagA family TonB-linked outer membrane protein n=1 Tax=Catenovulum sp. SX2 TaxID=3398614 RepID=UPI003F875FDA
MKMFKLNPFSSKNAIPQLCGSLLLMLPTVGYTAEESTSEECTPEQIELGVNGCEVEETIIVTGYSTQRKEDLTGAVTVVELDDIEDQPAGNIMRNLQGRIPGLSITTDGNPSQGATVRIRGQGLGRLGNNDPLYIVDGVPTKLSLHQLNSRDFESIQVLKDAAAASIYGARAANGVIVITTKKGKKGNVSFNVSYNESTEDFDYDLRPLNSEERAQVVWRAAVNDGTNPNNASPLYKYDWNGDYDNPELSKIIFPNKLDSAGTTSPSIPGTNWFDEVTQQAKTRELNFAVNGGSDRAQGYISLSFFDAEGVIRESHFERIAFRANSSFEVIEDKFTVGENLTLTRQSSNQVNSESYNILGLALEQQSIVPVYTDDGSKFAGPAAGITDRDNPVMLIEQNKDSQDMYTRFMGNIFAEVKPIETIKLRSNVALDFGNFYYRRLIRTVDAGTQQREAELYTGNAWTQNLTFSNTAEYADTFADKHNLVVLVGTETIDYSAEDFNVNSTGIAVEDYDFAFQGTTTGEALTWGLGDEWSLKSYFAKVDYNFDDKYLLSGTIRRDGSSRFGANNQYGNFPAVSAGWNVSNEDFFDVPLISTLKLRGSWGKTGNQEIDSRAKQDIFEPLYATESMFTNQQDNGTAYDIGGNDTGTLPSGFRKNLTGNPDLKWETSTSVNFGVDYSLHYGTIYGTFDWFKKKTSDILTLTTPLATLGEGAAQWVNGGDVENSGVEFSVTYDDYIEFDGIGEFKFDITANISSYKNEVVALPDNVKNSFGGNGDDKTILGHSVNAVYGLVADGLFQNQGEVDAHAEQNGAAPGRIRWRDTNGDGVISDEDKIFFTERDPDFEYGLNINISYENWDFNMFWQGVEGGQNENFFRRFTDFSSLNVGSNYGSRTLHAWTPENPDSDIPALSRIDNNGEGQLSSFYFEDASYLKLRNLSLGYRLDESVLKDWGISSLRFYIQGQNLITFTPDGTLSQDPEAPNNAFPIPRRFTVGFDLGF